MRMNIYVPDDLREAMNKLKKQPNWSALACQAFRKHLYEVSKMSEVVERLKSAAAEEGSELHAAGFRAGRKWAKARAKPSELERLAEAADELGYGEPLAPLSWSDWLFLQSQPSLKGYEDQVEFVRDYASDFWAAVGATDAELDSLEWLEGFVDGAVAVWQEVEDEL